MPRQTIYNIQKKKKEDPSSPESSLSNDVIHEEELEIHDSSKESVHPDLSSVYSNSQTPFKRK